MLSKHVPDNEKQFQCKECGNGFVNANTLKIHAMNVHIKTWPYQCRYGCENRYNDTGNRHVHEKRRRGGVFVKGAKRVSHEEIGDWTI